MGERMTEDELVEKVARAIVNEMGLNPDHWPFFTNEADHAIAAVREAEGHASLAKAKANLDRASADWKHAHQTLSDDRNQIAGRVYEAQKGRERGGGCASQPGGQGMTDDLIERVAAEVRGAWHGDDLHAMAKRVVAKVREADGWQPIETAPMRVPVDLWCIPQDMVGRGLVEWCPGSPIGDIRRNHHKSEEYGWFGNQSKNGVPYGLMPDLVPVAWRPAAPKCPPELIAPFALPTPPRGKP